MAWGNFWPWGGILRLRGEHISKYSVCIANPWVLSRLSHLKRTNGMDKNQKHGLDETLRILGEATKYSSTGGSKLCLNDRRHPRAPRARGRGGGSGIHFENMHPLVLRWRLTRPLVACWLRWKYQYEPSSIALSGSLASPANERLCFYRIPFLSIFTHTQNGAA